MNIFLKHDTPGPAEIARFADDVLVKRERILMEPMQFTFLSWKVRRRSKILWSWEASEYQHYYMAYLNG